MSRKRLLDLSSLKLGRRLTLCFSSILFVMFSGSLLLIQQYYLVRIQLERLQSADQELITVLRFQASLSYFRSALSEIVQTHDADQFTLRSESVRKDLQDDVEQIQAASHVLPSGNARDTAIASALQSIQSSVPVYDETIRSLANAKDWSALHDRLTNQLQPLELLSAELVKAVDRDVAAERLDASISIHTVVERMLITVILTGLLSLIVAGYLGIIITRSISTPLEHLMEGSRAIAKADFHHRIPVIGNDELAQVAIDMNRTTTILLEQFRLRLEERVRERTRVARDLHDTLLQTIDASKLVAEQAAEFATDLETTMVALRKLSKWLDQGTRELRAALKSLRTENGMEPDLMNAIESEVADIAEQNRIRVRYQELGARTRLPSVLQEEVHRIACEAIRNACVHAGGSVVIVEIQYSDGLVVRVCDDGRGIDSEVAHTGRPGHFGIAGMKERAARVGGALAIESSPGNGTLVILRIPRDECLRSDAETIMRW